MRPGRTLPGNACARLLAGVNRDSGSLMFTNVTLLFFLLLIPLAGFIAWAGDRIGHRTGKKRQSLFGLRPRHTAMVFTIGSGMAIALVSFLVFFLGSETFRIVVRDGAELYQTNRRLKQENNSQAKSLILATQRASDARKDVDRLESDVARLGDERTQAERARDTALKNFAAAQKRQTEAENRAKAAHADFEQATRDLAAARTDLADAKRRLTATQSRLDAQNKRIVRAGENVKRAEERLKIAQRQVQTAEKQVLTAQAQATQANREKQEAERSAAEAKRNVTRIAANAEEALKVQAENVQKRIDTLKEELERQNRQYAALAGKNEEMRLESVRLNRELEDKRKEYTQLVASTSALRRGQITYQVGEEVDRIAIRPGHNVWRLQIMLDTFLTTAAKRAEARGAGRTGKGKFDRALVLFPRPITTDKGISVTANKSGEDHPMTEDEAIRAAADFIRRANEDVVVVAESSANAVVGEPVTVDLRIHRNPVVLPAATKIGEITVNGEVSRQELADTLLTFLSRDIHKKLLEAGMIPPTRTEGESGGFSLSAEEWHETMEQVRKAGPRARVTVFAARDIRAADAPSLRFEVRPIILGVTSSSNATNR